MPCPLLPPPPGHPVLKFEVAAAAATAVVTATAAAPAPAAAPLHLKRALVPADAGSLGVVRPIQV